MSVLQMQRISICALKKDRKGNLEKIQSMGIMEMSQVADDEDGFEKMDTLEAPGRALRRSVAFWIRRSTILDAYAPEKQVHVVPAWKGRSWLNQEQFAKVATAREEVNSGKSRSHGSMG